MGKQLDTPSQQLSVVLQTQDLAHHWSVLVRIFLVQGRLDSHDLKLSCNDAVSPSCVCNTSEAATGTLDPWCVGFAAVGCQPGIHGMLEAKSLWSTFAQECKKFGLGNNTGQGDQNALNLPSVICEIHCGQNGNLIITLCLTTVRFVTRAVPCVLVNLRAAVLARHIGGIA